jgi:hypothetical protein
MNKWFRGLFGIRPGALAGVMFCIGLAACAQLQPSAPDKQLVGVWQLVTAENTAADGVTKILPFGPNPQGRMIFTGDGHFFSLNTRSDLPKFASGSRLQGTADENKAVVQGSIGSYGTYSVGADGKVLTLRIENSTWAHWIGIEQKRDLKIEGDRMEYVVEASIGGRALLAYRRLK